jgi:hypothetical protein
MFFFSRGERVMRGYQFVSPVLCGRHFIAVLALAVVIALTGSPPGHAQEGLIGKIDLMKSDGVAAVKGEWRYHPVMTGTGPMKNEIEPKAHGAFDDSQWEVLKPETLGKARGPGKYSWCWYRIKITVPDQVHGKPFEGGPVWFQTIVDDYGEIWVDGAIDLAFGKSGRGAVSGFNTRNRVRLRKPLPTKPDAKGSQAARDAKPGDVFQIAVLGINGPLGVPPGNFIFLRSPTNLEFFAPNAPDAGADKPAVEGPPPGKPVATINLMSKDGAEQVKGTWRRHLVTVHTGPKQNEIEPKAHGPFDDSSWEVIEDPADLKKAFGPGQFSMAWYRIKITVPEKVGDASTAGTAVWFRTTVDDYGEIWVNGKIDLSFGKSGRGAISGFNTANEVRLTDNAKPGETIQVAVLAINGPFGKPPGNRIFFRAPTEIRFFAK